LQEDAVAQLVHQLGQPTILAAGEPPDNSWQLPVLLGVLLLLAIVVYAVWTRRRWQRRDGRADWPSVPIRKTPRPSFPARRSQYAATDPGPAATGIHVPVRSTRDRLLPHTEGPGVRPAAGAVEPMFVSYSRLDRIYVERLGRHLAAAGISVWYDYRIEPGDKFDEVLMQRIDACPAFIIVLTPAARESEWVNRELNYAVGRKRPLLPLVLADYSPHILLVNCQEEDVRGGRMPSQRFIDRLRKYSTPDS
jgi:hypothetical protein